MIEQLISFCAARRKIQEVVVAFFLGEILPQVYLWYCKTLWRKKLCDARPFLNFF
jgi:hypothetical protein